MSPQAREAMLWIGASVAVAVAVGVWLFVTSPPFDELAARYSIL